MAYWDAEVWNFWRTLRLIGFLIAVWGLINCDYRRRTSEMHHLNSSTDELLSSYLFKLLFVLNF